jgi:hypothetical protein
MSTATWPATHIMGAAWVHTCTGGTRGNLIPTVDLLRRGAAVSGDEITDEDAVRALRGRGLCIVVGRAADQR